MRGTKFRVPGREGAYTGKTVITLRQRMCSRIKSISRSSRSPQSPVLSIHARAPSRALSGRWGLGLPHAGTHAHRHGQGQAQARAQVQKRERTKCPLSCLCSSVLAPSCSCGRASLSGVKDPHVVIQCRGNRDPKNVGNQERNGAPRNSIGEDRGDQYRQPKPRYDHKSIEQLVRPEEDR